MIINPQKIKRLLIVQIRPFGDVLLNTAYLPFLRRCLPDAKIDFLVKHPFQHVLDNNPNIDNCIVFGGKNLPVWRQKLRLFASVRRKRYDLVIDQLQGTTSAQIVLFSGATFRIASTNARWRFLYNITVPHQGLRYSASMKFDLLRPLGIEESSYRLEYFIQEASKNYISNWLQDNALDRKRFVCISPGSPREKKKWDASGYARLADLICGNLKRPVVLLWGPDEKGDALKVQRRMEHHVLLAPPTDFNQAAAMLEACELLVCNDGGLNHLSVATRTPSLAIFGGTSPVTWSPGSIFPGHHHLYNPEQSDPGDGLFGIIPESAYEKVRYIIEHPDRLANRDEQQVSRDES